MTPVDVRPSLIIAIPDGCGMKRLLRGNHSKAVNVAEGSLCTARGYVHSGSTVWLKPAWMLMLSGTGDCRALLIKQRVFCLADAARDLRTSARRWSASGRQKIPLD